MSRPDPTELTGLVLLDKLLELEATHPDHIYPLHDLPHAPPPAQVRIRQLSVLCALFLPEMAALSLQEQLESAFTGTFILARTQAMYQPLFASLEALLVRTDPNGRYVPDRRAWRLSDIALGYERLVMFRQLVERLRTFNHTILEANESAMPFIRLTNAASSAIDLSEIDTVLWKLIDPQQRTFTKADLITTHNYPPEDLFDLELDWL